MARIAVLHASFLGGGAEAVCLWALEALKTDHEVTLITFSDIDFPALNAYYGTRLNSSEIAVIVPYRGSAIVQSMTRNTVTFTVRQHLLSRFFKTVAHRFAIGFSTFNEMDFGRRGIQYVHFPMFAPSDRRLRELVNYPDSAARRMLRLATATLTGFSQENVRRNVTLTNSHWTAGVIGRLWGMTPRVVYPPVCSSCAPTPWQDRQDSFLCISRIVPEKRIEKAVMIVEGVRQRGFDVHLRIVGGTTSGRHTRYYDRIRKLQDEGREWLFLDHDLSRESLGRLLAGYKYGLHVRENEQFGIGIAEMVLAGCVPFVPASGGQAEIVAGEPLLTFANEREAIDKIVAVLSDDSLQAQLRRSLAPGRVLFSEQIFMDRVREAIAAFADGAES